MIPKIGEVWNWHRDEAKTDEIYGPGIVLGFKDGYEYNNNLPFVSFHFGNKGVMNIPVAMVEKFMYKVK